MRVLQIEDDVLTAKSNETILISEGHECDTAHFGEDAVSMAQKCQYDIILLDLGLPDMRRHQRSRMFELLQALSRAETQHPHPADYRADATGEWFE